MNAYSYSVYPVKWNQSFPSHWQLIRGKYLYLKENRPVQSTDEVVTCFRDGTVTLRKNRRTTGFTESLKEIGYQGIRKGDLVIHVMDAFAGAIGVSDSDGKGTPVYSVCTSKMNINNNYYAYLLRDIARKGYIQSLYKGIRERSSDFRFEVFANQFYPVPPREEQDQIVRFLDWKVSEINRLINIKRREIEKLEELKQTVIAKTVHRSFVNNTCVDSGVEWIGKIPKHWSIQKIKTLFSLRDERNYKPLNEVNLISLYTRLGVVQNKDVSYTSGNHARTADGYKIVYENDIIVNIILCWMGAIGMSKYNGVTSPAYDIYIPHAGTCSRYYHYLFRTKHFSGECYKAGKGIMAMRWRTYSSQFKNIEVPVPPESEQIEIADYLDELCLKYDDNISTIRMQIDKLHEFKTRLISDVVTGKIDVRGIEVPEFEYVEESADNFDGDKDLEEKPGENEEDK